MWCWHVCSALRRLILALGQPGPQLSHCAVQLGSCRARASSRAFDMRIICLAWDSSRNVGWCLSNLNLIEAAEICCNIRSFSWKQLACWHLGHGICIGWSLTLRGWLGWLSWPGHNPVIAPPATSSHALAPDGVPNPAMCSWQCWQLHPGHLLLPPMHGCLVAVHSSDWGKSAG